MAERMQQSTESWRQHGFDVEMTDLWYGGDRHDVVEYLERHGWNASSTGAAELVASHGNSVPATGNDEARILPGSAT
jgi:O-methyltransferase involved in polyketide biosynthesis